MTAITIERELLVRIEKELFLARNYGGTLRDEPLLKKVSTVLALAELERLKSEFDSIIEAIGDDPAPSTAPDELERLRKDAESKEWSIKDALGQLRLGDISDAESTLAFALEKGTS